MLFAFLYERKTFIMGIQHYKREAGDDAAAQAKRDGLAIIRARRTLTI